MYPQAEYRLNTGGIQAEYDRKRSRWDWFSNTFTGRIGRKLVRNKNKKLLTIELAKLRIARHGTAQHRASRFKSRARIRERQRKDIIL